jgi:hypothetical protein
LRRIAMARYSSLEDILGDRELGLDAALLDVEAVRRAIESKLKVMQEETVGETSDRYRRLIEARTALDNMAGASDQRVGGELIPIPSRLLERLIERLDTPSAARSQVQREGGPSAGEQMRSSRTVAVTKASQNFRNRRTLPLTALGAVTAALWATRQAFGANLTHVGTVLWAGVAGGILVLTLFSLIYIWRIQAQDEEVLRRLFDPDVQARALGPLERAAFTRLRFRRALWFEATAQSRRTHIVVPYFFRHNFRRTSFKASVVKRINELDEMEDVGDHLRWLVLKESLLGPYWDAYGPDRGGLARVLSTADLVGALDDAGQLAIARFVEMGALIPSQSSGLETFKVSK